jgi:hypothetical protein
LRTAPEHATNVPLDAIGPAPPGLAPAGWALRSHGPVLSDHVAAQLELQQIEPVNKALEASYHEFLELEARNTDRHTDDAGSIIVTIKPFPAPIAKLEDRLWSRLDSILDPQQQERVRLSLRLDPPELRPGVTLRDLVRPGFFGWGKAGARIELQPAGQWYRWKVLTRGHVFSDTSRQLPVELQRFGTPPAATNAPR